jgi:hypothetical protein
LGPLLGRSLASAVLRRVGVDLFLELPHPSRANSSLSSRPSRLALRLNEAAPAPARTHTPSCATHSSCRALPTPCSAAQSHKPYRICGAIALRPTTLWRTMIDAYIAPRSCRSPHAHTSPALCS